MPPKPVKRDSSATQGRYSPLSIPAFKPPSIRCPTPVDVPPETPTRAAETVKNVYKTYMTSLSSDTRAQALYSVFTDLANELEDTEHFNEVMSRISDNLREMGFHSPIQPCALNHEPCTLNHDPVTVTVTKEVIKEVLIPAQPCALSHDPVTVTVTKEVHPSSCASEMKKLRKELSDLTTGIDTLYHSTRITHTANTSVCRPPSFLDSSSSTDNDSIYDNTDAVSSVFSTPTVGPKPLAKPPPSLSAPPKSFATAAKTNVASTKSPKEIIRERAAKSCTNKGTPSNVLVLSDFKSANTAESYKRIAEMRKIVNDTLVDNKCKSISWSSRGNLVIKCAKPLSTKDKTDIIDSAKTIFGNAPTVLNKNTVSYVKFIDVPLFDIEGTPFDNNDFNIMIQQSEKWSNVNITSGPSIIVKKNTSNAKKATIKVGFTDDKNSAIAKRLLKTTILFGGVPIRCKPWTSVPPAPSSSKRASNASTCPSDAEVSSIA
ncbi:hypothetical protein M378DRAFT_13413 [Amanita muscaria Koide BX008]|uniref:Uncharacterized protein n=1 Tax=Amanita muscaria (strain Koide BX008) TaxID=946122 RepID=A0A0C2WXQ1_AMAMK|nr:hypothetical protein M378DRAFT_13413 [Amanita muscaria Koide BX008]